jgi:hypothetical protein
MFHKISTLFSKNAEFAADLNSVEKDEKCSWEI